MWSPPRLRRLNTRSAFLICLLLVLFLYHSRNPAVPQLASSASSIKHTTELWEGHQLRLVVPATQADSLLCKTLVSAHVLRYPAAELYNFGMNFSHLAASGKDGTHLGKIPGLLDKLKEIDANNDDQLVLIIDGLDTWFQLEPAILLSRYRSIVSRAQERTSLGLCGESSCEGIPDFEHVHQQVLFGAQKVCGPYPDEKRCAFVPPSTLPKDMYGPATDKIGSDEDNPVEKMRPRYLNSGFAMGPASAMRRLYEEANRRMQIDLHHGSDQAILSNIWADQEYARRLLRRDFGRRQPLLRRVWSNIFQAQSMYSDRLVTPSLTDMALNANKSTTLSELEYGISLDYFGELTHTMVYAHYDVDWIVHGQHERPSTHWQIPSPAVADFALPDNIRDMFRTHNVSDLLQTPLLTNLYTGMIPVSVHHNAWQHAMKKFLWTMWPHMWWHNESLSLTGVGTDQDNKDAQSNSEPLANETESTSRAFDSVGKVDLGNGSIRTLQQLCGEFFPLFELEVRTDDV